MWDSGRLRLTCNQDANAQRWFESGHRLKQKVEIKKNEDSNVQTNFIKIAADQPKLVYLEWIKIWVLSDLAIK